MHLTTTKDVLPELKQKDQIRMVLTIYNCKKNDSNTGLTTDDQYGLV